MDLETVWTIGIFIQYAFQQYQIRISRPGGKCEFLLCRSKKGCGSFRKNIAHFVKVRELERMARNTKCRIC